MLARSELNSFESKISEALTNNEIKHVDFTTIIEEKKSNIENLKKALEWWIGKEAMLRKLTWLKKVKIGISEVIKHNKIINSSLKT